MRDRPTASATSERDDTPSFANTLVRWPSTVFWERNSSSAISRLVAPSATRSAISSSRPLSAPRPGPPPKRRWRALTRWPSRRSSRAASSRWRLASQAASARCARGQQPHRLLAVAGLRQRDARQRPAARGRHRRLHRLRALGGPERQRGGLRRVAVGERQQRAGVQHPRLGERQLQAAHRLLGPRDPARGGGAVAALELRARQDGVEPAAPPGLDQRAAPGRPPPAAARCSGRARRSRARSRRRGRAWRA